MRPRAFLAEALLLVGFVLLVVALEEHPLRVVLGREDVRGDAVEEPAVVRDDEHAAGELEQRVLERAQRLDVEIVRRLVEQQHVAALEQRRREMQPAALAAGERADDLLLVRRP